MVTREMEDSGGKTRLGTRYFISSLSPTVKRSAKALCSQWAFENIFSLKICHIARLLA